MINMSAKLQTRDTRPPKLDTKDLRILRELELDARQSFGEIARKAGLSKEVVLYRVRNLERAGIIRGYITEIDLYQLGFQLYPLLFKFEEMPAQEEANMKEQLGKSKHVGWAARCDGAWDLNVVLRVRHAAEIAEFFDSFNAKYGNRILDKALMHTVSLDYFKRNFELTSEKRETNRTEEVTEAYTLGEKEGKLLRALSEDARKPVQGLAEAAGVSPPTAMAMIKRLEQQKIIQGYRIFTGFRARGYSYHKIWLNLKDMKKEDWKALYSFLSFDPYVLWATRTVGYYDFSIELEVPDTEVFHAFVNSMRDRFHDKIRKRDTLLVYEEITMGYLAPVS